MRRAKIISTLGPSSDTASKIESLIASGMNVARLNMSHGDHDYHKKLIENIRKASAAKMRDVAILMDLQGPKIRVDSLDSPLELKTGETWYIGPLDHKDKKKDYSKKFIPTVYRDILKDCNAGDRILFDDGLLQAKCIEKDEYALTIEILVGGQLKQKKGINLPDSFVSAPSFTEKDRKDLLFGLQSEIDYIALSFVRTPDDILKVKILLHELKKNVPIIAKIERPEAVKNIEEIIQVCDVIMVARGDMGVEVGNHLVPGIQKKIINLCNSVGRPVITATQMLESMVTSAQPTRAEASDVANAIWDGTDAVMLSGETAGGKNPALAVKTMHNIVLEAEKIPKERPLLRNVDLPNVSHSLQVAASLIAEKTHAKWIISLTETGSSCLNMSRFRPSTRVLGVTNSRKVARKMALYWGITPYYLNNIDEFVDNFVQLERVVIEEIRNQELIKNGDKIVFTRGDGKVFIQDSSNSIRVEIIKDTPLIMGGSDSLETAAWDRGKILLDTHMCASCQICIHICPHDIWEASQDEEKRTKINTVKAANCTLDMECVESCPTGAIEIIPENEEK